MCARFTVLSDTPIAAAIAGCTIPLSRNSTIWMRWRCAAGIFHRSAVLSRRTSALLHLTICLPRIRWRKRITHRVRKIHPNRPATLTYEKSRFKPLWRGYYIGGNDHATRTELSRTRRPLCRGPQWIADRFRGAGKTRFSFPQNGKHADGADEARALPAFGSTHL